MGNPRLLCLDWRMPGHRIGREGEYSLSEVWLRCPEEGAGVNRVIVFGLAYGTFRSLSPFDSDVCI